MTDSRPHLTPERLRELISYSPVDGLFHWKVGRHAVPAGSLAGSMRDDGYISIQVDGRPYMAHRLAWLHVYGVWPVAQLDHRNGLRADNRISNLREATNAENQQNCKISKNNTSGKEGVDFDTKSNKWRARITVEGKRIRLGVFSSFDAAVSARAEAKLRFHKFQPKEREA